MDTRSISCFGLAFFLLYLCSSFPSHLSMNGSVKYLISCSCIGCFSLYKCIMLLTSFLFLTRLSERHVLRSCLTVVSDCCLTFCSLLPLRFTMNSPEVGCQRCPQLQFPHRTLQSTPLYMPLCTSAREFLGLIYQELRVWDLETNVYLFLDCLKKKLYQFICLQK